MSTNESTPDPRENDTHASQILDPESGQSDDPRIDPTPDRRQTDAPQPKT